MSDVRWAFRRLLNSPGFTALVLVTLALGVGANTVIFSVVDATFLHALPYREPDRLVHLAERSATGERMAISYPNFLDWQRQQGVFEGLAVFHDAEGKLKTVRGTEMVAVEHVSAEFFDVLGVRPAQGREMRREDDQPGAERVGWLTNEAWNRFFGAAADVVGRPAVLDGRSVTVVGILPAGFRFHRPADLITPIAPYARESFLDLRENHSSEFAVARLKPGVGLAAARAAMEAIALRLAGVYPAANKGIGVEVVPLRERLAGGSRRELLLLLGAVGMVLLIACANVANMLLARSFTREREMAIRTSVGASRWQLLRQLLAESAALATVGCAAGTAAGLWAYPLASRLVPDEVRRVIDGGGLDPRMLLFTAGITFLTAVAFGLAPAWRLSRVPPVDALKQTPRQLRTVLGGVRPGDLLAAAQVALALVLLVGAGLLLRSLQRLLQVETGYEASRVLTLAVPSLPMERFQRDPAGVARYHQSVLDAVQGLPRLEAAAVVSNLAFTGSTSEMAFYREDRPVPAPGEFPSASVHTVSPGYFRAMGIPVVRGRVFDGTEPLPSYPPGVEITPPNLPLVFKGMTILGVVSRRMADRFWPGENPIGRRFRLGFPDLGLPWVEVVGVVGSTVQTGLDQGPATEFYLPLRQWPFNLDMHLVVRSRVEPASMVAAVRRAVASVVRDEPIRDVRVLADRIEGSTSARRFSRDLFACFAATALLLASTGLYGVLAFGVGRRTREIGIRMALGATRGDVVRRVVTRGLVVLVVPGLVVGLAGSWAAGRVLQSQLFEVKGADPLTFTTAALLMLATALGACWVPARRAARIDPVLALRAE